MSRVRKTDLAALGLINWRPIHGYALNHAFQELGLGNWTTISRSSIYSALRRLEKDGAVSITREREGNTPERTVYHLTDRGRELLKDILLDALGYVGPEDRYFYLGIMFADALESHEINRQLSARCAKLQAVLDRECEDIDKCNRESSGLHHLIDMMYVGKRHLEVDLDYCRKLLTLLESTPDYFARIRENLHAH